MYRLQLDGALNLMMDEIREMDRGDMTSKAAHELVDDLIKLRKDEINTADILARLAAMPTLCQEMHESLVDISVALSAENRSSSFISGEK
jgi:hypothetical protein